MSYEHPNSQGRTLREVQQDIMSRPTSHSALYLNVEHMKLILDLLGHPEQSFRIVHITGTNGKGSTARMVEAIARAYGLRTGLYTSPHLERINERIAIDGHELDDDDFIDAYEQIKDIVDIVDAKSAEMGQSPMSFFEVLTAMAIWAFADAPVDVAIVEVGMGGLWDATNALTADVAIIGPIDYDHTQWLGNTIEKIANEKSGIIKAGSTVIIGEQPHESVLPLLERAAQERQAGKVLFDGEQLKVVTRQPAVGGQMVTLRTTNGVYQDIPIDKFGEYQAHNALVALAAAEEIIPVSGVLDGDLVDAALSQVAIPGRIEQVRTSPTIIIDGGHNVNAAQSLRDALEENYSFQQLVGVIAMMQDKQVEEYLGTLEPVLSQVIVTENSWKERTMPAEDLEEIAKQVFGPDRVLRENALPDAIQLAVNMVDEEDELGVGYGHGIVVCGSFVTAGDARMLLKEHHNPDLKKPKAERN